MRAALLEAPIDDAEDFAAARELCGEAHLPTRLAGRFENDDLVSARGGDPRRFETGRAGADDNNLAASHRCWGDDVRHARFPPGRGIVDAERVETDIDAVDAVAHADAGADVALAA